MIAGSREYRPSPTLARFHACDALVRGVMGPVGSGKSVGMCAEIFTMACRQRPGPDGVRRSRWLVVRNTYPELRDTTMKTWLDWFPEDVFGPIRNDGTPRHVLRHSWREVRPDGTTVLQQVELEVLFRSLSGPDDVRKVLSLELTGAWVNEAREIPLSVVRAIIDRLGRYPSKAYGGASWCGLIMDTNPPDTDHWWYQLAEVATPDGWAFFRQPGGLLVAPDGSLEPNPQAENLQNLPRGYYTRQIDGDRDHALVYYAAQYGFVRSGKPVFPGFTDALHVRGDLAPVPGLPVHVGMDFGLTPAAVFGQREATGRWLVLDEIVCDSLSVREFAERVRLTLQDRYAGCQAGSLTGDPAGEGRSQTDGQTCFSVLRAAGLADAAPAPTNSTTLRLEVVKAALGRLVDGTGGLLVAGQRCPRLRKALAGGYHYAQRTYTASGAQYHDSPAKDEHSHVADALQYLLLGAGEGRAVVAPPAHLAAPAGPTRYCTEYDPYASMGVAL